LRQAGFSSPHDLERVTRTALASKLMKTFPADDLDFVLTIQRKLRAKSKGETAIEVKPSIFAGTKTAWAEKAIEEDVNETDRFGNTALHFACRHGEIELARKILDKGADPDAVTAEGDTPLLLAAATGSAELVDLLLEHGADPTPEGPKGTARVVAETVLRTCGAGKDAVDKLRLFEGLDPLPDTEPDNEEELVEAAREEARLEDAKASEEEEEAANEEEAAAPEPEPAEDGDAGAGEEGDDAEMAG
jgi:ankyrin repeat protein